MQVDWTPIIVAFIGGGAGYKAFEKIFDLALNRGKSVRDELRQEIARLEGNIQGLEKKVDHLEAEVETWKTKVDEWKLKYFELFKQHQLLEVALAKKDQLIESLTAKLAEFTGDK
jgi:chromosome segregation ATPase